jgi:hypothetical protein
MHPDVNLSLDEAQILFALAQSAISAVILDMAKITAGKAAAVLMAEDDEVIFGTPVSATAALNGEDDSEAEAADAEAEEN